MEMREGLNWILEADDGQIIEIFKALIRRNNRLHPDSELVFLSLPRDDPQERERVVLQVCGILKRNSL